MTGTVSRPQRPKRVHIIGGPGSGKTAFAAKVGAAIGVAPVHLDDIARVSEGNRRERHLQERRAAVAGIAADPSWITEGVHLGWTEELLRSADMIIWLDYVAWHVAARRIVLRFAKGAIAEARRQRGLRRFLRFRDYARRLAELLRAIPETRDYYRSGGSRGTNELDPMSASATEAALRPYLAKTRRCRSGANLRDVLRQLETAPKGQ